MTKTKATRSGKNRIKPRLRTLRDLNNMAALIEDCAPNSPLAAEAQLWQRAFNRRIQSLTLRIRL